MKRWWLVVLIGLGVAGWQWMGEPEKGIIEKKTIKEASIPGTQQFEGMIAGFEYGSGWEARVREDNEERLNVEVVDLAMGGDRMVVGVKKSNGPLSEESGIVMRLANSNEYEESGKGIRGGRLFWKKGKGEWVWFGEEKGKTVTVSLVSPNAGDEKIAEVERMVNSVRLD